MSRDLSSQDWVEEIMAPRERDLNRLRQLVTYVQKQAYYEGLTRHLRPGVAGTPLYECPFCSNEVPDLPNHLITCDDVPPELKA